jgi:hypothetical protein
MTPFVVLIRLFSTVECSWPVSAADRLRWIALRLRYQVCSCDDVSTATRFRDFAPLTRLRELRLGRSVHEFPVIRTSGLGTTTERPDARSGPAQHTTRLRQFRRRRARVWHSADTFLNQPDYFSAKRTASLFRLATDAANREQAQAGEQQSSRFGCSYQKA